MTTPQKFGASESEQPTKFDGKWLIDDIHRIGAQAGFERSRQDRGSLTPDVYYEVGYGPLKTVTMVTSAGDIYRVTDHTWRSYSRQRVQALLDRAKLTVI